MNTAGLARRTTSPCSDCMKTRRGQYGIQLPRLTSRALLISAPRFVGRHTATDCINNPPARTSVERKENGCIWKGPACARSKRLAGSKPLARFIHSDSLPPHFEVCHSLTISRTEEAAQAARQRQSGEHSSPAALVTCLEQWDEQECA